MRYYSMTSLLAYSRKETALILPVNSIIISNVRGQKVSGFLSDSDEVNPNQLFSFTAHIKNTIKM